MEIAMAAKRKFKNDAFEAIDSSTSAMLAARIGKRHQGDSCCLRSGAVSACPQAG
jgi:hypothetical protein